MNKCSKNKRTIGGMRSRKLTKHRMNSAEIEVRKCLTRYLKAFEYKSFEAEKAVHWKVLTSFNWIKVHLYILKK